MKEQEARALVARIAHDYAGRIEARFDASRVRPQFGDYGYRVSLLLKPEQRQVFINRQVEWEGISDAWQWFLEVGLG